MSIYQGISGLEYLDTDAGKAALGLSIERFMETIASTTNTFAYLRTPMKALDELKDGTATAYYDVMEIIGAGSYVPGNVKIQEIKTGQVKVNMDVPLMIAYGLSDIDDIRTINDYETKVNDIVQKVWPKFFNAQFIGRVLDAVITNGDDSNILELAKIYSTTITDIQANKIAITDKVVDMCKVYSKKQLGAEYSNFACALEPKAWNRFSLLIENSNTESGVGAVRNGNKVLSLGGLPFILDDMLGNQIKQNQSFSLDYAFDFTHAIGIASHKGVCACPIRIRPTLQKLDNNFNVNIGQKALLGFAMFDMTKTFVITDNATNFKASKPIELISTLKKSK